MGVTGDGCSGGLIAGRLTVDLGSQGAPLRTRWAMLKTFGALMVGGQSLVESAPVWLESARHTQHGDHWSGTILLDERPRLVSGSHMVLLLDDGRQADVILEQMHPGADGGLLVRFKSSTQQSEPESQGQASPAKN